MRTAVLSDIIELIGGGTPKTSKPEFWNGYIPWLSVVDFGGDGRWVDKAEKTITNLGLENSSTKLLKSGDIVISARGTVGELAQLKRPMAFNQSCYGIRARTGVDQDFLYYLLKKSVNDLRRQSHGGVFNTITRSTFDVVSISIPSIVTQKKIADILSSLDEKIELNRLMNETLEQLGQALFRHYFIDNPDAKNWKKRSLGEFFPVKTGKKDANFGTKDGKFPFFTCAQTISRAPSYSFDGSAILIAGNGDFNIKYYTGKFEAYQRTYVLIPHNEELLGFLYFLMKKDLSLITGGSRGSVIKFITKGMIENYRVELPDDNDLAAFAPLFSELLALISHNNEQVYNLIALRDTLLPQLMSGKIEVK